MLDLNEAAEHMRLYNLKERGQQLRKYRREWGIDLDYVARLAGLTKSTLSKFERGRNDLRVETYARLLDAVEQIGEARAEVLEFELRVTRPPKKGEPGVLVPVTDLMRVLPSFRNAEERKTWIANETKDQIE